MRRAVRGKGGPADKFSPVTAKIRRVFRKGVVVMKRWANHIGPNLTRIRRRRGWTQEQLAAKLQLIESEMTRQVVANIEARRRRVYEDHLRALVKVLRCDLDELFFGAPPALSPRR